MRKVIDFINEGTIYFPVTRARDILKQFNKRSKGWNLNRMEDIEDFIVVFIKWCFNNDIDVKQGCVNYLKNFIFTAYGNNRYKLAHMGWSNDVQTICQNVISDVEDAIEKEDAETVFSIIWKSETVVFAELVNFVACLPLDALEEFTLEQQ